MGGNSPPSRVFPRASSASVATAFRLTAGEWSKVARRRSSIDQEADEAMRARNASHVLRASPVASDGDDCSC